MRFLVLISVLMFTLYMFRMTVVNKNSSGSFKSEFHERSKVTVFNQSSPNEGGVRAVAKKNLMFIRTHKCGTSTLVNVFYLFGIRRRLNFVMNSESFDPPDLEKPLLPPRPGSGYNIQCYHVRFRPKLEHLILPRHTSLYVSIVRSTVSHFKSGFTFYGAEKRLQKKYGNLTTDELIEHFLDGQPEPTEYSAKSSPIFNSMAFDFGWQEFSEENEGSTLQMKIDAFINYLDEEMDYIMITDRMDESLIILKEYLGWNMIDIVYLKRKVSIMPKVTISDKTIARILKYQVVDDQIFHHFNASFEQHLDRLGRENVASQVKEFRKMRETFENKCFNKDKIIETRFNSVTWELSDYGKNINVACKFLQTHDAELSTIMKQLQLSQDYTVPINKTLLMQDVISRIQRDYDNNEYTV